MEDGRVVLGMEFIEKRGMGNGGMMYRKEGGERWRIEEDGGRKSREGEVGEVEGGSLMVKMREKGGGRGGVYSRKDLGKSWKEEE